MTWLNLQKGSVGWLGIILITVSLISVQSQFSWLVAFPEKFFVPFDLFLNLIMDLMIKHLGWFFMGAHVFMAYKKGVASITLGCYGFDLTSSVHYIRLAVAVFAALACFAR